MKFLIIYFLISLGICIFLGALGELLQYMNVIPASKIVSRINPHKHIHLFNFHKLRYLSFKQILILSFSYFKKVWKISYLPVCFALILAALLSAGISNDIYRLVLGNHIIGQISVIVLAAIIPLSNISALTLGYSMVVLHNGTGTMFTLLLAAFIWKFIYEGISKNIYPRSYLRIFIFTLFIISIIAGYLMNLYGV